MTYNETLEYLFTQLPMYQHIGKKAYNKNLVKTLQILDFLGNPHKKFKSVHIAGTNGKGTSAHGIAAVMQTNGYKIGLYTSPHLKNFTERIKINGAEVTQDFVVDFVHRMSKAIEKFEPSFFEITVAMAFDYFAIQKVDLAVIETGLGGRLDSTNVIIPEVSLITHIGYDHTDILGNTLEEIATEKAGIIKKKVPVVIGEVLPETQPVFELKAKEKETQIYYPDKIHWESNSIIPDYLKLNIPSIQKVCEILNEKGFENKKKYFKSGIEAINKLTGLKGRFQFLSNNPTVIADVSHNVSGLKILFEQINRMNKGVIHLIFGTIKNKELKNIFELFPVSALIYWTQSTIPRALPVEELAIAGKLNGIEGACHSDVNEAIRKAKEKVLPQDIVLITGSTFVISEIDEL